MMGKKGIGPIVVGLIVLFIVGAGGGTYYFLTKEKAVPTGCLVSDVTCSSDDQCCSGTCKSDTSRPYSQEFKSDSGSDTAWCNFKCPADATKCEITRFYSRWTDLKIFSPGTYPSSAGSSYSTCQIYNWKITVYKYQKYCTGEWCGDNAIGQGEQCDYTVNPTTTSGCLANERKTCRDQTFGVNKCTWTECECIGSTRKCGSDLQPQKCLNGDWTNFCEGDYCQNSMCKYGCYADGRCNSCPKDATYCSSDGKYVLQCTGTATTGYSEKIISTCGTAGCSSAKCKPSPQCPATCPEHINKCKAWECGLDFQCSLEVSLNYSPSWTGYDTTNKCKVRTCVNGEQKIVNAPDGQYSNCGGDYSGCIGGVCKTCSCDTKVEISKCVNNKQNVTKQICDKATFTCKTVTESRSCECNPGEYRCNPFDSSKAENCVDYQWATMLNCQGEMICQEK